MSQEAGQVVWYSHLFQNFPQFIVIHTVKGFGIVNKAEKDGFLDRGLLEKVKTHWNRLIMTQTIILSCIYNLFHMILLTYR